MNTTRHAFLAPRMRRYDNRALRTLPARCTTSYASVGQPLALGPIEPGDTVLDHACGTGMDLLMAARATGPRGRAIGVDRSPGQCAQAALAAGEAGVAARVDVRSGDPAALPVSDASVDVVISNGVMHAVRDRQAVMAEIARVLRPGGRLLLVDLVMEQAPAPRGRWDPASWAASAAGAWSESALVELARSARLAQVRVIAQFDRAQDTAIQRRFGRALPVRALGLVAVKPTVDTRGHPAGPR